LLIPSFTYLTSTLENCEISYGQIELLAEDRTAEPVWLVAMGLSFSERSTYLTDLLINQINRSLNLRLRRIRRWQLVY